MATRPNEYHLLTFDPGGKIGWAHFLLSARAFSRPEHKVLRYLKEWDCGEFTGLERDNLKAAVELIKATSFGAMPYRPARVDVVSEDFELTQTVGGKNLLSPVRINSVLDWECGNFNVQFHLQRRQMRTNVTPERLKAFGFDPPGRVWTKHSKGKDAFAAMQHGVVWLRRLKEESRSRPWKMSDGQTANAFWDCACRNDEPCDLRHR